MQHIDAGERGGGAERMAGEALAVTEDVIVEPVRNLFRENRCRLLDGDRRISTSMRTSIAWRACSGRNMADIFR